MYVHICSHLVILEKECQHVLWKFISYWYLSSFMQVLDGYIHSLSQDKYRLPNVKVSTIFPLTKSNLVAGFIYALTYHLGINESTNRPAQQWFDACALELKFVANISFFKNFINYFTVYVCKLSNFEFIEMIIDFHYIVCCCVYMIWKPEMSLDGIIRGFCPLSSEVKRTNVLKKSYKNLEERDENTLKMLKY